MNDTNTPAEAAFARLVEAALAFAALLPEELLGRLEKLHVNLGWPAEPGADTRELLLVTAAALFLDARAGRSSLPRNKPRSTAGTGAVVLPSMGLWALVDEEPSGPAVELVDRLAPPPPYHPDN
jgi:hypothetical protein